MLIFFVNGVFMLFMDFSCVVIFCVVGKSLGFIRKGVLFSIMVSGVCSLWFMMFRNLDFVRLVCFVFFLVFISFVMLIRKLIVLLFGVCDLDICI